MSNLNQIRSDKFWYDDMSILIKSDRLTEFFPVQDQTLEERFNSLVRLSLYCSILLFYYHQDYRYFSIFIGSLLFTYYIYTNKPEILLPKSDELKLETKLNSETGQALETLEDLKEQCTAPTLDNPFMNVTMKDYLNIDPKTQMIIDRPEACDTAKEDIKKSMDEMFNHNLFKDVNDVFGKMNSQRQFYTMPNTTIPNAQDEFARWLYLNPKTCKEDQEFCLRYEDVRAKRPVFVDPTQNPITTKK